MSKSEFFEAADEILREVEEEFKSIPALLQKMLELQNKLNNSLIQFCSKIIVLKLMKLN